MVVVAVQFFVTNLTANPTMLLVAVVIGGLGAWRVAAVCQREGTETVDSPEAGAENRGRSVIELEAAQKQLKMWAEANPYVLALLIFGSYAKGTATSTSDLDVAVVIAPAHGEDAFTTWMAEGDKWADEVRALLGFQDVDLQWWDVDGGTTPTIAAGLEEATVSVYRRA